MCIFRPYDGKFARMDGVIALRLFCINRIVVFLIKGIYTLGCQHTHGRPTHDFFAGEGEMHIDVATMDFEHLIFWSFQCGVSNIDKKAFSIECDAFCRTWERSCDLT